jgi:hypothetical protein
MDAVIVEHESLEGLLKPIDVDERDDEDAVGAMRKLENA